MVIVFFSILNQMELYLLQNLNENGHHDHIPFDLKENENLILWVGKLQQTNEKITSPRQHGQFFFFSTLFLKKNLWNGISRHHGGSQKPCSTSQHCGIELLNDGPSIGPPLCRETSISRAWNMKFCSVRIFLGSWGITSEHVCWALGRGSTQLGYNDLVVNESRMYPRTFMYPGTTSQGPFPQ